MLYIDVPKRTRTGEWSKLWADPIYSEEEELVNFLDEIGIPTSHILQEPIPHILIGPALRMVVLTYGVSVASEILFDKHCEIAVLLGKDLEEVARMRYEQAELAERGRR